MNALVLSKLQLSRIFLGVALLVAMLGCGEQTSAQAMESGKAHMEKRAFRAALLEFKNVLQKDPTSTEARFWLGKALFEAGDPRGALVEFEKAKAAGYSNDQLAAPTVVALVLLGQIDKLIADYAAVELTQPKQQAELKATLAVAYGMKGNYALARSFAEAALKADPSNVAAQLAVVRLMLIASDRAGALARINSVLKGNPNSGPVWVAKGEALLSPPQDVVGAGNAFKEALRVQKDNTDAHVGLVGLLLSQRDIQGAERQFAELKKIQPTSLQVRYLSALIALDKKDLSAARDISLELLKQAPDNSKFLYVAGLVEYERGSYLRAVAHLGKALLNSLQPRDVRVMLARAQLRAGDPVKAISALQPLLDTPDKRVDADVFGVATDAYIQIGGPASLKRMKELAVRTSPRDIRGRTALAFAEINEGRADKGLEALRVIASDDSGVQAEALLFKASLQGNRLSEAEDAAIAIGKKLPKEPVGPFLQGQVEVRRNNVVAARSAFEAALKLSPSYGPAVTALAELDLAEGKPDNAVKQYQRWAEADPKSPMAAIGVEVARMHAGASAEESQARMASVAKRFPDSAQAQLSLLRVLLDRRDLKTAVQLANEAAAKFPDQAVFPELVGRAELAAGNINQAEQAFGRMAVILSNSPEPSMRLADVELARKNVKGAIGQLRKALSLDAGFIPAHSALIFLFQQIGQLDEALLQAKALQRAQPASPAGWTFEGMLMKAKGNLPGAIAAYKQSLAVRPQGVVAGVYHQALLSASHNAEAARFEADWVSKLPMDPEFNTHLGDVALASGDFSKAESLYRKVVAASPANAAALNNVAWLSNKQGKTDALEFATRALRAAPRSAPVLETLADIHRGKGHLTEALSFQQLAVEAAPDEPFYRLRYAQILVQAGKKSEARAELEKIERLGDRFSMQADVQQALRAL